MSSQSTSKIDLDYKYNNYNNNNINQTIHNHYYIPSQIYSVNHKIRKKKRKRMLLFKLFRTIRENKHNNKKGFFKNFHIKITINRFQ